MLQGFVNVIDWHVLERSIAAKLAPKHGEHAVADSHDWEVLAFIQVVLVSPVEDLSDLRDELAVLERVLSVSWDVDSVGLGEKLLHCAPLEAVVNGDDASAASLQELSMGSLEVGVPVHALDALVLEPQVGQGLCQHTNEW